MYLSCSDSDKPEDTKIKQLQVEETTVEIQKLTMAIQIGIFNKKGQALEAKRKISSKLNLPMEIVLQWDYLPCNCYRLQYKRGNI